MKLAELFETEKLIQQSSVEQDAGEIKIPSVYEPHDYGSNTPIKRKKVVMRSTGKDGKIYGRRTIWQRDIK